MKKEEKKMVLDDFFRKRREKKLESLRLQAEKEKNMADYRAKVNTLQKDIAFHRGREPVRGVDLGGFASTIGRGFKAAANYAGSLNVPDAYDVGLGAQKKKIDRARKKAKKGQKAKPEFNPSVPWIGDDYLKMGGKFS